ncbi:MAG: hypothetical protein ACYTAF_16100, partial [Planctomycetota bacterium]
LLPLNSKWVDTKRLFSGGAPEGKTPYSFYITGQGLPVWTVDSYQYFDGLTGKKLDTDSSTVAQLLCSGSRKVGLTEAFETAEKAVHLWRNMREVPLRLCRVTVHARDARAFMKSPVADSFNLVFQLQHPRKGTMSIGVEGGVVSGLAVHFVPMKGKYTPLDPKKYSFGNIRDVLKEDEECAAWMADDNLKEMTVSIDINGQDPVHRADVTLRSDRARLQIPIDTNKWIRFGSDKKEDEE